MVILHMLFLSVHGLVFQLSFPQRWEEIRILKNTMNKPIFHLEIIIIINFVEVHLNINEHCFSTKAPKAISVIVVNREHLLTVLYKRDSSSAVGVHRVPLPTWSRTSG